MHKRPESIWTDDTALEARLRTATGDNIENLTVVIPPSSRLRFNADLVGTLAGIAILSFVIVLWLLIGPALQFNST
jgi:low-affinity ferrous iron transport protein